MSNYLLCVIMAPQIRNRVFHRFRRRWQLNRPDSVKTDNNSTAGEPSKTEPLQGSTSDYLRHFPESERPARYPYEENSIPETPARDLHLTELHSNICSTQFLSESFGHNAVLLGNTTVQGTAGLVLGFERSPLKTEETSVCVFRLVVPEGI